MIKFLKGLGEFLIVLGSMLALLTILSAAGYYLAGLITLGVTPELFSLVAVVALTTKALAVVLINAILLGVGLYFSKTFRLARIITEAAAIAKAKTSSKV